MNRFAFFTILIFFKASSFGCLKPGYIITILNSDTGPRFERPVKSICGYHSNGPAFSTDSKFQLHIHRKQIDEIVNLPEFTLPQVPPPVGPWSLDPSNIRLDKVTFVLPAKPGDQGLDIFNSSGLAIDSVILPKVDSNVDLELVNQSHMVKFVLVSQGFLVSEKDKFLEHFASMKQNLLTYEPFRSRSSQISFESVFQTADLECKYQGRLIICNGEKAIASVVNAGLGFTRVIVMVNNSEYGGSGGDVAAVSTNEYSDQIFVHELAHSFAGLVDEYTLFQKDGVADWKTHGNCFAGSPPAWQWEGLSVDYTPGCNYPNWYRSSKTSIMYDIQEHDFNPISRAIIANSIDQNLNQ